MKSSIAILLLICLIGCHNNDPVSNRNSIQNDTIPKLVVDSMRIEKGEKIKQYDSVMTSYFVWHLYYHFTNRPSSADWFQISSEPVMFQYSVTWDGIRHTPGESIYFRDTVYAKQSLAIKDSVYKILFDVHYWSYDHILLEHQTQVWQNNWIDSTSIKW